MHSSKTPPSMNSDAWPPATPSPGGEDCEAVIEKTKDLQNSTTASQRPFQRTKIRLASAFFAYFVVGWGDGVTGTLLPHFKSDLHLSFLLSSLFWVASATGYLLGTIVVEHVTRLLGRTRLETHRPPSTSPFPAWCSRTSRPESRHDTNEKTRIIGFSRSRSRFYTLLYATSLHAVFFVIMGSKSGYPSMMIAYVISSFARSFITGDNVYVPSVSKRGLGFFYGSTSAGSFAAPLVCQSIVATGIRWADFYYGSLVLSAINTTLIVYAFRPTQEELQSDAELAWELYKTADSSSDTASSEGADQKTSPTSSTVPVLGKTSALGPRSESNGSLEVLGLTRSHVAYKAALGQLQTWASALFALLYTGSESVTQGFIAVYLLNVRSANPSTVGYVTSGFWGGMTLSRITWGYCGNIISFRQRKWIVQACITENLITIAAVTAFTMHLLLLLVPSFVGNAVSTAIIGTVYGPIFPANIASARDLLPAEVHLVSLAIVAACASFGAALFPFIAGLLSTTVGARTFPYITIAQCVAMFCVWFFFPSRIPGTSHR
ncbi:MFS general substrate transporter [Cubamyces menziesii]|nr:MFS general substrate transporter [Cubamyces menziesii]